MSNQSHALMLPLPIQSPTKYMLKLAELLYLNNIRITFLNTQHIQKRLFECTDTEAYFAKYSGFRFETIPDGLLEDNPRTIDQFPNLMKSMENVAGPLLEKMLTTGDFGPCSENPVTCIVSEAFFNFPTDVASRVGLPMFCFDTFSPSSIWVQLCLPGFLEAGELPFKDDNLDELIKNAPGMEGIMRRRDLPSFCRSQDIINNPEAQLILNEIKNIPRAQGLILNTFHDLDGPILSQILKVCQNVYAIGPVQAHLKTRLGGPETQPTNSNSIWKEDRSCISWLDQQPSKSVLYVSIGSLAVMTKDQLYEIWYGLVNSGSRFLWVRRPDSVTEDNDEIPIELAQGTEERGCIVSWAPQEEVLGHHAVGGFLTHSGWASTLETIVEGKPMICWPHFVDQQVISRYVGHVWKLGLDMKDVCDRVTVEKMIRELMELRKVEFLQRAEEMAKLAKSSVSQGGSSFANLDRLVQDIKMIKMAAKES